MSGLAERIAALIEDRAAAAAVQEAPTAAEYGHTAWNTHGEGEQYNDNVDDEQPEENVDEDVENIAQGEDQEQDGEDGKEKEQTMPVFGKKTAALARYVLVSSALPDDFMFLNIFKDAIGCIFCVQGAAIKGEWFEK